GTTWAVMALALALPENHKEQPELTEVRPAAEAWIETSAFGGVDKVKALDVGLRTTGRSTLLMAVANDSAKVKALIDRGADVSQKAKSGQTALTVAATYRGNAPVLRMLVGKGA